MFAWRKLASVSALLFLAGSLQAQSVDLREGSLTDEIFRIELSMKLDGKSTVQQEGKFVDYPLQAQANHEYLEKVLEEHKLTTGGLVADKSARVYRKAKAVITQSGTANVRTFRKDRTWLVAQRVQQTTVTFCPDGPLTRDEVDLTEHFNSLAVPGLLPGKEVKVGDTWDLSPSVVQALCGLEALDKNAVSGKLTEVKDGKATFVIEGSANGIDLGATVAVAVNATGTFDIQAKRLARLTWKQVDQRGQGPANPGMSANIEITLKRETTEEPAELNKVIVGGKVPAGDTPPAELTRVSIGEPGKRFTMEHGRDWVMTAQNDRHTVLRLMKQGAFVAQATITPWPRAKDGSLPTFKDFISEINATPGWDEETVHDRKEELEKLPAGYKGYRYAASGKLEGRDVMQYFYLLANGSGDHLVVTFTMNPMRVAEFAGRDSSMINQITIANSTAPAGEPAAALPPPGTP